MGFVEANGSKGISSGASIEASTAVFPGILLVTSTKPSSFHGSGRFRGSDRNFHGSHGSLKYFHRSLHDFHDASTMIKKPVLHQILPSAYSLDDTYNQRDGKDRRGPDYVVNC